MEKLADVNAEKQQASVIASTLQRFSIRGKFTILEASKLDKVYVLPGIALLGEATVLYAAPGTGKTLISLKLLNTAIDNGDVSPEKVYFVNADDSYNGAVDKLGLTEAHRFHYLVPGHQGFTVNMLRVAMVEMIEHGTARGAVLILDTLKKFVDLMDKSRSREFSSLVRRFCSKGGTVIAFAHTNKHLDADGYPKYAGTSDIVDDFDCAVVMRTLSEDKDKLKLVEFKKLKSREGGEKYVYCTYSDSSQLTYGEKMASVHIVPDDELARMKLDADRARDSDVVEGLIDCIALGVTQRMALAREVGLHTGKSRNGILKVLDTYVGTDETTHLWSVKTGPRGAKIYKLLKDSIAPIDDSEY